MLLLALLVYGHLKNIEDPLQKALYLNDLQDRNTTLFYRLLLDYIEELAPIVYTPTVGRVCQEFGDQFRRSRGMYFSAEDKGQFSSMMWNWPYDDVMVIVITDGSRILGLGDLGANGMGIPIGKLSLYCAAGGIHPRKILPIMFDVGTDNQTLIDKEYYLGLKKPRVQGEEYQELLDELMNAIELRFPNAMVQFEDFSSDKASDLLLRYRDEYLCFNDDIQGTGCVTLAGVLAALRAAAVKSGYSSEDSAPLKDQRVVIAGSGSAGLGIASALAAGMMAEEDGLNMQQALERFWIVDANGLLTKAAGDSLTGEQQMFARADTSERTSLLETVKSVQPTIMIGATGCAGLFSEEIIREMKKGTPCPLVFPLSNPTSKAEAQPKDIIKWCEGSAVVATGSPFDPVEYGGHTHYVSQCNNMYIFPGIGLGACLAQASKISDRVFYNAAKALSCEVEDADLRHGIIFPNINTIRDVSLSVARSTIETVVEEGNSKQEKDHETFSSMHGDADTLERWILSKMYFPVYDVILNDFQEP